MERILSNNEINEISVYTPERIKPKNTIGAALVEMLKKLFS